MILTQVEERHRGIRHKLLSQPLAAVDVDRSGNEKLDATICFFADSPNKAFMHGAETSYSWRRSG